ncbi:MAG: putative Mg2+ transporter-C (MgtC) family protein [Gaiellaceae bacterium]|jgi:putative Mg2+ transporter-C (MgtC) family protein|nr:putative Mg2+ transporter-C (MgtC) family protein [Gaiellaceae bacterium]
MLLAEIPSLSWEEALLRLALAAALGGAVGLEREFREREAGFRTHMLVSVGSALFTIASAYGFRDFLVHGGGLVRTDPTRIAAQIVTGIGFLGAGAIIRQGFSVRGLTTAATLWVVAAIGLTAGAGYYSAAAITTALVLFSLWPLRIVAFRVLTRFRPETERLLAQLPAGESPAPLIEALEELGARLQSLEIGHEADRRTVLIDVTLPPRADAPKIVAKLSDLEHVLEVRWSD